MIEPRFGTPPPPPLLSQAAILTHTFGHRWEAVGGGRQSIQTRTWSVWHASSSVAHDWGCCAAHFQVTLSQQRAPVACSLDSYQTDGKLQSGTKMRLRMCLAHFSFSV